MATKPRKLILASGSAYRRELLQRICPDFDCIPPDIDESARAGEAAAALSARLAEQKALGVAAGSTDAVVIGSDQVADLNGRILGKPGNRANAIAQLTACAGQTVVFHTAVCVCCREAGFQEQHVDRTTVQFRPLAGVEIEAYLDREQPWDCAGSFRSEGLGAVLFESVSNEDPTALIGLPLIWLAGSLRRAGLKLL